MNERVRETLIMNLERRLLLMRFMCSFAIARDFVKRALRVGRGAGGAGGSVTDGASPGRAHTASDLAAVYGNRTATMSHAKRRFS